MTTPPHPAPAPAARPPAADNGPAPAAPEAAPYPGQYWDQRYASADGYLFGTAPNAWLREQAAQLPRSGRALCVADGEGRNSVFLAQHGLQVQAFDIAPLALQRAQALAAAAGVQIDYRQADCAHYPWPVATQDVVAAIFVQFADPPLRSRLFAQMAAALKPGGRLLLLGYTPQQLHYRTGGPSQLSHLYTEALLRSAFAELDILALHSFEADMDEGPGHRGRSALISLVAQRPAHPAPAPTPAADSV